MLRQGRSISIGNPLSANPNLLLHQVDLRRPLVTYVDGVFEGGGTLGSAYAGALRALEDNNIWFQRVAGTSAGAITAALIAAGYNATEMEWLSGLTSEKPDTLPAGT